MERTMDGEEERAMDEDKSEQNSQTETVGDEPRSQEQHSRTPPLTCGQEVQSDTALQTEGGSDDKDDKEEDREEQTSGTVWGHGHLSRSVYGSCCDLLSLE